MLQILDTAWKDHLLAMDHLRASVGLRGYAQVDPEGGIQARGHADLRADVEERGRAGDRSDLPHGAARRVGQLALDRKRRRSRRSARPQPTLPASSRRRSTARRPTARPSRSATAASTWAATIRAPAAAARSSRTAACRRTAPANVREPACARARTCSSGFALLGKESPAMACLLNVVYVLLLGRGLALAAVGGPAQGEIPRGVWPEAAGARAATHVGAPAACGCMPSAWAK